MEAIEEVDKEMKKTGKIVHRSCVCHVILESVYQYLLPRRTDAFFVPVVAVLMMFMSLCTNLVCYISLIYYPRLHCKHRQSNKKEDKRSSRARDTERSSREVKWG